VASAAMLYGHLPIVDVFRRLDAHTLLGVMDARGIPQPFFFTLRREGGERRRFAGMIASVDTRQQLAMEARSRRYKWIPGPITTVHDELTYRKLTAAAKICLTSKRWISDRSRSAAVVLGNHSISVRRTLEQPWLIAKRDRNLLSGRTSSRIVNLCEQVAVGPVNHA